MTKKYKIVIFTQEDYFFIPQNIEKIGALGQIQEIVILDNQSSLKNKSKDFIKWFGIYQVAKMGLKVYNRKFLNFLDKYTNFKILKGRGSVKMISKRMKIPLRVVKNINNEQYIQQLKSLNTDLIVSYSCPVVLKNEILSLPKDGVLNVHGSYLPFYRGLLPSFWHLRYSEEFAGATVHYMSKDIDDGDIVIQEKVNISKCNSMFDVMRETKKIGGELMKTAVQQVINKNVILKANNIKEGSYFSWPKKEDIIAFKKLGKRFV